MFSAYLDSFSLGIKESWTLNSLSSYLVKMEIKGEGKSKGNEWPVTRCRYGIIKAE